MSEAKQNTPKLRFPGFTDPWEQCKLGELLEERDTRAPQSDDYPLMAFIANEGVAPKGERYDRSALVSDVASKTYKQTEFGDFIYSSNNLETGSIGLNKYGNACISPVYSIFLSTGLADPDFLGRRLVRRDIINEMVKWRQGVVYGQWRIHESDFIKIDISVPSLAEQRSIGSFLDNLDSLITLHQRKIEHLKLQKRGFLQKMFPKDGADRPEIRLPGFTDPWKRRKLGELASFSKGVGYSKADISETGMPFIHYGRLYTNHEIVVGQVDTFVNPIPGSVFTEGSEVITPSSGETAEDIAIASAVISPGIILGGGLNIVRPGSLLEPIFLALSISYGSQHKELSSKAQGKSVVHLYNDDLKSSSLFYPRIAEQRQIGAFFRQLDSLISLHQRKLEHLHVQKKALLQQMFI